MEWEGQLVKDLEQLFLFRINELQGTIERFEWSFSFEKDFEFIIDGESFFFRRGKFVGLQLIIEEPKIIDNLFQVVSFSFIVS